MARPTGMSSHHKPLSRKTIKETNMRTMFTELTDACSALGDGDYEDFVKRFWIAENLACDLGERSPCAVVLLEAWLLNGFLFGLEFMDLVGVLNAVGRDCVNMDDDHLRTLYQSACVCARAFVDYCKRYNLTPTI